MLDLYKYLSFPYVLDQTQYLSRIVSSFRVAFEALVVANTTRPDSLALAYGMSEFDVRPDHLLIPNLIPSRLVCRHPSILKFTRGRVANNTTIV